MSELRIISGTGSALSSEDVKAMIEDLRNRILGHNDLKKMRTDDAFILRFLHKTDFNVDDAFKTVKNYYRYILEDSDWLVCEISDRIVDCLKMHIRAMLPATDKYGKKIFYMRTDTVDPSKITISEMNQVDFIWFESVLDDPHVQEHGLCLLVDISGFSWKMMKWLTLTNMKMAVRKLENILAKDATFHVVRCSRFSKIAVNTVWPFIPEQIKKKFKFHYNDLKPLLDDISRENLPKEYGGTLEVDFERLNEDLLTKQEELHKKLEHYKFIIS